MQMHLQPVEEATLEQVDVPEGGHDPLGIPCWNRLMVGTYRPLGRERRFAGKICDPVGDSH